MEYAKFGRQRAETGARLRVVKALTGMPTAFSADEAARPLVFSRVVQNTDYLLKTPEGRLLAAAQATGTQELVASLYGKQALPGLAGGPPAEPLRNVTEGESAPPAPGERLADEAAADDWAQMAPAPAGPDELMKLGIRLEEYLNAYGDRLNIWLEGADGKKINPYELAMKEYNNPAATAESHRNMLDRIDALLKRLEATA
jgi:hypothetical protein